MVSECFFLEYRPVKGFILGNICRAVILLCRLRVSCMVNLETKIIGQNVHIGYREIC